MYGFGAFLSLIFTLGHNFLSIGIQHGHGIPDGIKTDGCPQLGDTKHTSLEHLLWRGTHTHNHMLYIHIRTKHTHTHTHTCTYTRVCSCCSRVPVASCTVFVAPSTWSCCPCWLLMFLFTYNVCVVYLCRWTFVFFPAVSLIRPGESISQKLFTLLEKS